MNRLLSILCIFLTLCSATILTEETIVELRKAASKNNTEERSSIFLPTVIYDGYALSFYSDYPIENAQIIVGDEMGNEILNIISTIPSGQPYILSIPPKNAENYILRITIDKTEYYGYF